MAPRASACSEAPGLSSRRTVVARGEDAMLGVNNDCSSLSPSAVGTDRYSKSNAEEVLVPIRPHCFSKCLL